MSQIKLVALLVFMNSVLIGQKDQTLFRIDDVPVKVSEFQYIYEKNNREKADYTKQSVEEYLDLYINFKLKVHKAKELKYDQSATYQQELAGYRLQLADSYVIDREVVSRMVEEIYQRSQTDVELRHILISSDSKAAQKQKLQAQKKISDIKRELDNGKSFDQAVVQYSQDRNSSVVGGNIGYVNAPLPEGFIDLEDAAYSLKEGEISQPVKTALGYHIIQVVSKRPARGVMEAKHLLIRKEKNGIKLAVAYPRIKRIHDKIASGETTFEEATIISSEDKDTKGNSGNLGFFGIGQYERSFEDAAFALKVDGDISPPIETSIGWHIIKRVSKKEADTKEIIEERLKSKPKSGERFDKISRNVVESIKKEAGFKEDTQLLTRFKSELAEDFFNYNWKIPDYDDTSLISFGSDAYDLNDFTDFAKKNNKTRMRAKGLKSTSATADEIYDLFVREKAISFAEARLEERYPEFRNLMREYREGILLFDLTKDMVWDKASKDTSEIRVYYDQHKSDYVWEDRAQITQYTISSLDPTLVTKILNASRDRNAQELSTLFNSDSEVIHHRQETLEKSNETLKGMTLQEGYISAPAFKKNLKVTTFKKVEKVIPSRQKTLKEARGYIISDYQDQLDKKWIEELKKQYKVKVNKKVLKNIIED